MKEIKVMPLHKKIECYLFENQSKYFDFKLIDKEAICDFDKIGNRVIKIYKLDLLGADEDVFYMIEIKTRKLTLNNIYKYEKAFHNFNFIDRGISIIFVIDSIDKKAKEFIEKSTRYKLIYISELTGLEKYIPKEFKINADAVELDEYRISFLLKLFFSDLHKYYRETHFGNTKFGPNYSKIRYTLENNYYIYLNINRENIIVLEVVYFKGEKRHNYEWYRIEYYDEVIYGIVYMQKLIKMIRKLPDKEISDKKFEYIYDLASDYTHKTLDRRYEEYKKMYIEGMKTISKNKRNRFLK
ncbi:MAG TPA: hypothetical protein VIK86_05720 [Candidatus Paceibacterota bacterium]